jgi:hypothetical protein
MDGSDENANVEMVKRFLRGQNLEQVARVDEAVELYESMLAGRFDSVGPYDRLIDIYSGRSLHGEVVRVAEAAIVQVHTYPEKTRWYEQMRDAAAKAATSGVPRATPKNSG